VRRSSMFAENNFIDVSPYLFPGKILRGSSAAQTRRVGRSWMSVRAAGVQAGVLTVVPRAAG
jgi:hypothetical protein